ncbi:hypothetical protein KP509_01G089800 [Ceratopteris richardii]|uniref:Uncharacterized protein n=2 Tax=Ceratopteris richardii TaxID=49495 RepID=A0A8T2VF37_CERRI|nr:hypothetical protein KP509_01G089800 [Ceratopteris richardii]KAH7447071.1 hypothetical protein KP509_01G089800 [Ceratopteris richardii]
MPVLVEWLNRKALMHTFQDPMDIYTCNYSYSPEVDQLKAINENNFRGSTSNFLFKGGKDKGTDEVSLENAAIARKLASVLLGVDRSLPREVARADWSKVKRLPWVLQAKNAMTLEDVKQLLIDLESGIEIFKDQKGWRKSVQAINSFDVLNNHIQYLKHSVQQKVDDTFKKLRRIHLDQQIQKQKNSNIPSIKEDKWREMGGHCQPCGEGNLKCASGSPFFGCHSSLPPKCLQLEVDDVGVVLDSMGFLQATLPMPLNEPVSNDLLHLTKIAQNHYPGEDAADNSSKENILLFQMAAQISSHKGGMDHKMEELSSPPKHQSVMDTTSLLCSPVDKFSFPKEEQEGCGFRMWKPEGSLVSSVTRNAACC